MKNNYFTDSPYENYSGYPDYPGTDYPNYFYPGGPYPEISSCPDYYGPEYNEGPCPGEYPDYGIYDWIRLAEAFVLWQKFEKLYCPEEALQKGTLFSELWQPYGRQKRKEK